jgi:hypothetical protein
VVLRRIFDFSEEIIELIRGGYFWISIVLRRIFPVMMVLRRIFLTRILVRFFQK